MELIRHIRDHAASKGIFIDHFNCHLDHVHCLISLKNDQNLADVVHCIKGESSHWINQVNLVKTKFAWQTEYYAVSVSESALKRGQAYIRNQQRHHERKTFEDEILEFIKIYGFEKLP
jgi:REP element-mobilizing transposase RayT